MLGWIHRTNLPKSNVLEKDLQLRWNFWPSSWCSCFGLLGVVFEKMHEGSHQKSFHCLHIHLKSPRCCMMPQRVITEWQHHDSIHLVILLVRSEAGVLSTWWSPWSVSWHELGVWHLVKEERGEGDKVYKGKWGQVIQLTTDLKSANIDILSLILHHFLFHYVSVSFSAISPWSFMHSGMIFSTYGTTFP